MGKKTIHGGLIIRGTLASGSGDDLLTINATTGEVGKISGTPLTTTLTAGSIFLGNASNVATATAITGDVTIDSSGVTAITAGVIVNADINASAAIAVSKLAAVAASRALVSDASGFISAASVTSTELGYVSGVTSAIQTQLNSKQATITGGATTIVSSDLTANRALISGTLGKVEVSSVTNTELGYLSGVTSAIQTQFSGKLSATISGAATGDILYYNGTAWVNLPKGTDGQTLRSSAATILWDTPTINGIPIGGTDGQVLTKQSGTDFDADWETITVSSITDLTATAAELNLLDGVTATTTELNYLSGVTSNIQSQLGNKLSTTLPHHALFVGNVSNIASNLAAGSEGQVLTISSGAPTWTTVSSSGVTTIAALDGTTKSANAAAISGVNLYLQTADDTYPGVVSTGTQTFAGAKTFVNNVLLQAATVTVDSDVNDSPTLRLIGRYDSDATASVVSADYNFDVIHTITAGGASPASRLSFKNHAGTEVMSMLSSGNVGIGNTSPGGKLTFENTNTNRKIVLVGSNNDYQYRGFGTEPDILRYSVDATTSSHVFYAGTSTTTSSELMRLTGTGNLGIGITPTYKLHVNGEANVVTRLRVNAATQTNQLVGDGTAFSTGLASDFGLRNDSGNILLASGSATPTVTITSTGDVGVGETPSRKLHVTSSAAATNTVTQVLRLTSTSTGTPAAGIGVGIEFETETASGNVTGNRIESVATDVGSGSADFDFRFYNMQAGGGAAETFRITSVGDATLQGTGTADDWVATSDIRVKSNISKVSDDVLSEIGRIGELFSSYEKAGKTERGFIAQELLEVAPEYVIVPEDPEQMMAVNYAKMAALLFKGFQQLLENGPTCKWKFKY